MVAHFNAVGVSITESAERLRVLEKLMCDIEDAQQTAPDQESNRKLSSAYARRDRVLEQVDIDAHNWHATFALVERCKAALASMVDQKDGRKMDLVLAGNLSDLQIGVLECTDFDLYDAVCQRARVYPNDSLLTANLRRGRLLDAMLARNGRTPIFATLTEAEALAVGNQFVELLMARVGRNDANAIVDGKRMLDNSGLMSEIEKLVTSKMPTVLSFKAKQ
ncbi:hypothetical protein [Massilia sp. TWP1-3-3]|uniref:hypothetical protein n=1 Tax=Massilia sp. TWP1-3-3 TaxID=2804573 RepID=UPI003CFA7F72